MAATSLALLAPLFLLICAVLSVGLGRPVFTSHRHIGFAGRRFTAYTFSAPPGDGARRALGDAHIVGCFVALLRDSGLDRLPQLINVLRGDMSIVGPRAIEADDPSPLRPDYFSARPGLIGIGGIARSGRRVGEDRRAAMDRFYARRWTIWLDLAALARSLRDAG